MAENFTNKQAEIFFFILSNDTNIFFLVFLHDKSYKEKLGRTYVIVIVRNDLWFFN